MALKPGEDLAATLFADVRYFYGDPTARPPHHRFEKGSYVYLFENAGHRRARIEIANKAGTAEQDAFDGYLDGAHIQYSYKHTTLVTLTVESPHGQRSAPLDVPEWHLPTFDPKNENKYMYKLHSLDIYFWAKEDAIAFVNGARRVLSQQQVTVLDEPATPAAHHAPMSPVVQKLENVAITDPSYSQGQTKDSRGSAPSFPGPPISATPQSQEATNFAPMAYNPAAPAAPEAIKHREKTPPPEDGAGNPLIAAAAVDHGQYSHPGFSGPPSVPQSQASYFPQAGIPPAPSSQPPASSAQSPFAHHFQNTFAPPPTAPTTSSPYAQSPPVTSPPASAFQPQAGQPGSYPASHGVPSAVPSAVSSPGSYQASTTSQQHNAGLYSPPAPQAQAQAAPASAPPGGFTQFNYGAQASSGTAPLHQDYGVHSQVYRPTESESKTKHNDKPVATTGAKPPAGKLEMRASQLEKGVGGFLKKLEKKYG